MFLAFKKRFKTLKRHRLTYTPLYKFILSAMYFT